MGIILSAVVGIAQWFQTYISLPPLPPKREEKPDAAPSLAPDPRVMQVFMLWGLPFVVAFSTYYFVAGIGMYWLIGTLFMIAQQQVVNLRTKRAKAM